jgi:hypothetical protein
MPKENWGIISLTETHTTHGLDIQEPGSTIIYPCWAQPFQYDIKFVINAQILAGRCDF